MTVQGNRRDISEIVRVGGGPPPPPPGGRRDTTSRPYPLLLALMSVVVPGTGHLYAGHRRTGTVILALFGAIAVLAVGVVLVVPWEHLVAGTVRPKWLNVAIVACAVLAASLVLVVLDAYRLGRPRRLPAGQRVVGRVVVLGLCVAMVTPLGMLASYAHVQRGLIKDIFPDQAEPPETGFAAGGWTGARRLNVLLVGGDGAAGRPGIRADSVTVASIDTETGNTILFSVPRNLENAPFPEGTPADERFPNGYDEDFFYGVYEFGLYNPDYFPGSSDPGASAVASSVSEILGLPVHYYVRVNMLGFRKMIDALGGVRIRVPERLPIGGGVSTSGERHPIIGYIEPGLQTLDGFKALWFARSRAFSDDYSRMARQRCVLGALARQADPVSVLRHYRELAGATKEAMATNIPQSVLPDLVYVAAKVQGAEIKSLQFVPPMIDTGSPDFDFIRHKVDKVISKAERSGQKQGAAQANSGDQSSAEKGLPSIEDACQYE